MVFGEHLHGAAGLRIGDPDILVVVGQQRDGLGHEVHCRFDDDLLLGSLARLQRQGVGVADAAAVALDELHDLAAHVKVSQKQQRVAEVIHGRSHVAVEPGEDCPGQAVGKRLELFGVGLELLLVPIEGQLGLAEGQVGLKYEACGAWQGSGGGHSRSSCSCEGQAKGCGGLPEQGFRRSQDGKESWVPIA